MSSLPISIAVDRRYADVRHQLRLANVLWVLWFLAILATTAVTGLFFLYVMPLPLPVGLLVFLASVVAIVVQPRYGLYFVLCLSLAGDSALLPWYPFVKNMSSQESILYINGALIVSPMECYLALILVIWLGKGAMQRKIDFYRGELFWPAVAFALCVAGALVYGLMRGGNSNVALWEVRPILLLPVMTILTSNLLERPEHVTALLWWIMTAILIEGFVGTFHYLFVLHGNLNGIEAITEHSAAIHMNTLFVFAIVSYLYHASLAHRFWLPLMAFPVLITYFATQRRAAYLSLGIAIIFVFVLLFQRNRKLFWMIVPAALIFGTLYLGAFWNSSGALAQPASAVKSMVAPDTSSKDYSSNLYRVLENINVAYTIKGAPLTGVGFGNKFHITVAMPDISFFIWWEYIVHNSILWMWMQMGVIGFVSMLYLVGSSILTGIRALWKMPDGAYRAAITVATLYIVMHFMYAYVDMSWDTQSMLYIGTMMGVINVAERLAGVEAPQAEQMMAGLKRRVPAELSAVSYMRRAAQ